MKVFIILLLLLLNFNALSVENLVFHTNEPIYVIGDIHGDLVRAQNLLRGLSLIDQNNRWTGGRSVLVQTGDRIDRWHQDYETLNFFNELVKEAKEVGGEVFNLVGNHELRNSIGKFLRHATSESYRPYKIFNHLYETLPQNCKDNYEKEKQKHINSVNPDYIDMVKKDIQEKEEAGLFGRVVAFCPGGYHAKNLAKDYGVLIVNDIVFVHGSLEKAYSNLGRNGLAMLNLEIQRWFKGESLDLKIIDDDKAPFDSRYFAEDFTDNKCADLTDVLLDVGAKKMVIGHTIQSEGITSFCENKLFRIDVGMSRGFSFKIPKQLQALKIVDNKVEVISVDDEFRGQDLILESMELINQSTFSCENYIPSNLPYNRCSKEIAIKIFKSFLDDSIFYSTFLAEKIDDLFHINPLENSCLFQIKNRYILYSHFSYIPLGQEQNICKLSL